jgi:hypothetical protein
MLNINNSTFETFKNTIMLVVAEMENSLNKLYVLAIPSQYGVSRVLIPSR